MTYIPTEEQRIKVYHKLKSSGTENNSSLANTTKITSGLSCQQKLSAESMAALVERLTKVTKREYLIENQVQNILKANRSKRDSNGQKVEDRLLKAGRQLQNKKEQLKNKEHMRIMASMQSTPSITEKAKRIVHRPFVERVDAIVSQKQDMLRKLAAKASPIFKPELNPYSLFIAEVQSSKNFLCRASEYEQSKKEAMTQKLKEKAQEELRGATFNPQINDRSRTIAACRPSKSLSKQSAIDQNRFMFAFKPKINHNSVTLAKERAGSACHQRLYDDMRQADQKKQKLIEEQQQKYAYKPSINRKSLQIVQHKRIQKEESFQLTNPFEEIPFAHEPLFQEKQHGEQYQTHQNEEMHQESYEEIPFREVGKPESIITKRHAPCRPFSAGNKTAAGSRLPR